MGDGDLDTEARASPGAGRHDGDPADQPAWPPPPPWGPGVLPPAARWAQPVPDPPPRAQRSRRARVLGATLAAAGVVWAAVGIGVWAHAEHTPDRATSNGTDRADGVGTIPAGAGAVSASTASGPATTSAVPASTASVPATTSAVPASTPVTINSLTPLGEHPPTLAGTVVTAPDGSFAITLPPDWRAGFVGPRLPPLDEQLFPGDPDGGLGASPVSISATPDTRMFALPAPPSADGSMVPDAVLQIDGHKSMALDNLTGYAAVRIVENRSIVTRVIMGEGTFDAVSGPVGWAAFHDPRSGFDGVRYLATGSGWEWTVTYWTRSTADGHVLGDQMVASLTPRPAGT